MMDIADGIGVVVFGVVMLAFIFSDELGELVEAVAERIRKGGAQ